MSGLSRHNLGTENWVYLFLSQSSGKKVIEENGRSTQYPVTFMIIILSGSLVKALFPVTALQVQMRTKFIDDYN